MDQGELWADDTAALAQIGARLFPQDLTVRVVLPAEPVRIALAAWRRDDLKEHDRTPAIERHRRYAGTLALIGLAAEDQGLDGAGDGDVTLDLNAWNIGTALDAAEDSGLLSGRSLDQ